MTECCCLQQEQLVPPATRSALQPCTEGGPICYLGSALVQLVCLIHIGRHNLNSVNHEIHKISSVRPSGQSTGTLAYMSCFRELLGRNVQWPVKLLACKCLYYKHCIVFDLEGACIRTQFFQGWNMKYLAHSQSLLYLVLRQTHADSALCVAVLALLIIKASCILQMYLHCLRDLNRE